MIKYEEQIYCTYSLLLEPRKLFEYKNLTCKPPPQEFLKTVVHYGSNFFSSSSLSTGFPNECIREAEKDSLNEEQGVISDSQEGGKFSMTPSPKLRSSKKLLGLLTQNRSHLFLSSYPLYVYGSSDFTTANRFDKSLIVSFFFFPSK